MPKSVKKFRRLMAHPYAPPSHPPVILNSRNAHAYDSDDELAIATNAFIEKNQRSWSEYIQTWFGVSAVQADIASTHIINPETVER